MSPPLPPSTIPLTIKESMARLERLGWRIRDTEEWHQATRHFQLGWAGNEHYRPIAVDGIVGLDTSRALLEADNRRRVGRSTASPHFSFREFACTCKGAYIDCPRIWVRRELLHGLEVYRAAVNGAVRIMSGCRCEQRNHAVGGARSSQHKYGAAADIYPQLDVAEVKRLRMFSGIGHRGGLVVHVDVRHKSGHNPTNGTIKDPTIWAYR